jgi:hypothetical protein
MISQTQLVSTRGLLGHMARKILNSENRTEGHDTVVLYIRNRTRISQHSCPGHTEHNPRVTTQLSRTYRTEPEGHDTVVPDIQNRTRGSRDSCPGHTEQNPRVTTQLSWTGSVSSSVRGGTVEVFLKRGGVGFFRKQYQYVPLNITKTVYTI